MNLDDLAFFHSLDSEDMIQQINGLPSQLMEAYQSGLSLPLPEIKGLQNVLVAGMGGSAIGADLVSSYVAGLCPLPVIIHRDYGLPAWARGSGTLVITSSHSGNTEETIEAFDQAVQRGCQVVSICTGGKLAEMAKAHGIPAWTFNHHHAPRTAVGFSFGLILALLQRTGYLPDQAADVAEALHAMRNLQTNLMAEIPAVHNPAKRLAGQLYGRWISVFSADYLSVVARRWKGQFSELAKAWGQFEYLPEADHNTLAGTENPESLLKNMMAIFLKAPGMYQRNLKRLDLTHQMFMQQGINTDTVEGSGDCPLAHIWTALLYGDYTSYYLAMAYGVDPTPIAILDSFKAEMAKA